MHIANARNIIRTVPFTGTISTTTENQSGSPVVSKLLLQSSTSLVGLWKFRALDSERMLFLTGRDLRGGHFVHGAFLV